MITSARVARTGRREAASCCAPTNSDHGPVIPTSGIASGTCNSGFEDAQRYEFLLQEHRYFIEATAVYVDLT